MSSESDSDAQELTLEYDAAIDRTLADVLDGKKTSVEENLKSGGDHEKDNKVALERIFKDSEKDSNEEFLKSYFQNREWTKHQETTFDEEEEENDVDQMDDALEFEERFNFRFQEENADVIQSYPRRIEGEEREFESQRKRKRKEEQDAKEMSKEEMERKLNEIDERYKKLKEEQGSLTPEQLSSYTDEIAAVYVEEQGGAYKYDEIPVQGGVKEAVKIIEEQEGERKRAIIDMEKYKKRKRGKRKPKIDSKPRSDPRMASYYSHRHK